MTNRAVIVAIEEYPESTSLAKRLEGTNQDAELFRNWLTGKKGLKDEDIFCCAGPNVSWRTAEAKRDSIITELLRLSKEGHDKTEELYILFSGHGFSYSDSPWGMPTDVLVASDFIDTDQSGASCLKLQEIQTRLWNALGPGHHYYFIDACRNSIQEEEIQVLGLGKKFPTSVLGKPIVYTMYSTAQGLAAKTKSCFANLLVNGLEGYGRAKSWEGDRLFVTFEMLCEYIKEKIPNQEIDSSVKGLGKGYILEVNPVPLSTCDVVIDNAEKNEKFKLIITNQLGPVGSHNFKGPSYQVFLKPFDYFFEVIHPGTRIVQVVPPTTPLDLYEPCQVHFQKEPGEPLASAVSTIELEGAPGLELQVEQMETGFVTSGIGFLKEKLFPGNYILKLRENGVTVGKQSFKLLAGQKAKINILDRPIGKIRESILKVIPEVVHKGVAFFSETVGQIANWDLGLWLSIIGGSRIVSGSEDFSKLKLFPLPTLEGKVKKDESMVYVLAGFEKFDPWVDELEVALSKNAQVSWKSLDPNKRLDGIYESLIPAQEGPYFISFKTPKWAPISFVTHCLPNRATLIVITEDFKGKPQMHQYLLPISSNLQYMDPIVTGQLQYLLDKPMNTIKYMALAQTLYGRNRSVMNQQSSMEARDAWEMLIYGKWIDPIMSLIAAYEMIRTGRVDDDLLRIMVENLRRFFPGIADTEVIARMIGMAPMICNSPPIFLDGILAAEGQSGDILGMPIDKLDYDGPWTTWLGGVNA